MKNKLLCIITYILLAGSLIAQEKLPITLQSNANIGEKTEFKMGFHYPAKASVAYLVKEELENKKIENEGTNTSSENFNRRRPEISLAIDAGYILMGNKHGTNQGYIGGILGFSSDEKRPYNAQPIHQIFLGAGINYGRYNKHKTEAIPTFSVAYMPHKFYLYSRLAMSKYHVHPSVGFNLFNLTQIHVGYSHGYHRKNGIRISGPTLSINLNLGINHLFNLSN